MCACFACANVRTSVCLRLFLVCAPSACGRCGHICGSGCPCLPVFVLSRVCVSVRASLLHVCVCVCVCVCGLGYDCCRGCGCGCVVSRPVSEGTSSDTKFVWFAWACACVMPCAFLLTARYFNTCVPWSPHWCSCACVWNLALRPTARIYNG
jgi:hypothetical protein